MITAVSLVVVHTESFTDAWFDWATGLFGCCQNERYRRRLQYHRAKDISEINQQKLGKLVL